MKIIYRISDAGYNKVKPEYINNENCLKNFTKVFNNENLHVIADNCSEETLKMLIKYVRPDAVTKVSIGHGAGTFNLALDKALKWDDNEIVYFLENDYLHKPESDKILKEGFDLGASFVALYDHPDKYMNKTKYDNPELEDAGEKTTVYLSDSRHWKITNSTTMTFATRLKTLREDFTTYIYFCQNEGPLDYHMFLTLRQQKNRKICCSIPACSTHSETEFLAPLINWEYELNN